MRLQFKIHIVIDAPSDKVWHILAHDFAEIGKWASAIPASEPALQVAVPVGADVGGRVCATSVPGYSRVQENFLYCDEEGLRFGYLGEGLPTFIQRAENHLSVRSLGTDQSEVESSAVLDLKPFPGLLLAPLIQIQMQRVGSQTFEELKYYVERGEPHPRKRASMKKRIGGLIAEEQS